jgi:hypothetical protein
MKSVLPSMYAAALANYEVVPRQTIVYNGHTRTWGVCQNNDPQMDAWCPPENPLYPRGVVQCRRR